MAKADNINTTSVIIMQVRLEAMLQNFEFSFFVMFEILWSDSERYEFFASRETLSWRSTQITKINFWKNSVCFVPLQIDGMMRRRWWWRRTLLLYFYKFYYYDPRSRDMHFVSLSFRAASRVCWCWIELDKTTTFVVSLVEGRSIYVATCVTAA